MLRKWILLGISLSTLAVACSQAKWNQTQPPQKETRNKPEDVPTTTDNIPPQLFGAWHTSYWQYRVHYTAQIVIGKDATIFTNTCDLYKKRIVLSQKVETKIVDNRLLVLGATDQEQTFSPYHLKCKLKVSPRELSYSIKNGELHLAGDGTTTVYTR